MKVIYFVCSSRKVWITDLGKLEQMWKNHPLKNILENPISAVSAWRADRKLPVWSFYRSLDENVWAAGNKFSRLDFFFFLYKYDLRNHRFFINGPPVWRFGRGENRRRNQMINSGIKFKCFSFVLCGVAPAVSLSHWGGGFTLWIFHYQESFLFLLNLTLEQFQMGNHRINFHLKCVKTKQNT